MVPLSILTPLRGNPVENPKQNRSSSMTQWRHLSSSTGDLPPPNRGKQQTAALVADLDRDGRNDFVITERTEAPSVVWYRLEQNGWRRHVLDPDPLRIEAGSAVHDIDGDGDPDIVFGGDSGSDQVWWWENPGSLSRTRSPWRRHTVKSGGAAKHHDQLFGDFDGDGRAELAFWNQGARTLFVAEIPEHPRAAREWLRSAIYTYEEDSQMLQRGSYPSWKGVHEHEGLAAVDVDADGKLDIVGGGRWFKHVGEQQYVANIIDASYPFTRAAAGQLIEGGRPEVIFVAGDGTAPLMLYQWEQGTWMPRVVIESVQDGHSLGVLDFDGDRHLDIFIAEMMLGSNPDAKTRILLGDGQGSFRVEEVCRGCGLHEARIADLDGDGDFDILAKPYTWDAPRLDLWINGADR
jgi:hypothetical protein